MVRDPTGYTHFFYEDEGSHYAESRSGRRSSRSSRSSHVSSRVPSVVGGGGVPVMPQPQPPPPRMPGQPWMGQGMPGGGMGMGMGMGMGQPPMMGGHPAAPVEIVDGMNPDDDDVCSMWSGSGSSSGYMSEGDDFGPQQQQYPVPPMGQMPPPGMNMRVPPMMPQQQQPPMPQPSGFGGGAGFVQLSG